MKKIQLFSLFIGLLFFTGCKNNQAPKTVGRTSKVRPPATFQPKNIAMVSKEWYVPGCGVLKKTSTNAGIEANGFETKKATLIFDAKVLAPTM